MNSAVPRSARSARIRPVQPVGLVYLLGAAAAATIGLTSGHLEPVVVGLFSLLPVFSHVRHVGVRRAITEPRPVTFIVAFYFLVFPLRALVVAANHYTDVLFVHSAVTSADLTEVLFLASAGTTMLVECYYLFVGSGPVGRPAAEGKLMMTPTPRQVIYLSTLLTALAIAGLLGVIAKYGGLSGAEAALSTHAKATPTSTTSLTGSAWSIFAEPAVWCAAYVVANRATSSVTRSIVAVFAILILAAMLVLYGSRLNAILALVGAWVVFHYSGGRVPLTLVLAFIPVFGVVSAVIVGSRAGGTASNISTVERYSRIAGYGALDVSLALWERPAVVRQDLTRPNRWLDLPGYLVPSQLWPGRPDINAQRLDVFVAQAIGTADDRNAGFPPTYLMEDWLLGGWPLVLVLSAVGGAALGWADRKLVRGGRTLTPGRLFAYCFLITSAFDYYKDGDMVTTFVGDTRSAVYLGALLLITGVWAVRLRASPENVDTATHGDAAFTTMHERKVPRSGHAQLEEGERDAT